MKLLLDTHVFFWAVRDPALLSLKAREALLDVTSELSISAVTGYELAQKHHLGRMPEAADVLGAYTQAVSTLGARSLAVTHVHALAAGGLDWAHRDPFDRMIVAQAITADLVLVTGDRAMRHRAPAGLTTLW